ncbi:MAG: GNAT family N-acetyltransferase, partial [Planctomycetota bacterium]|nr:GNAT family N-acetyltransferase [Planctomycetota bacterium]
MADLGITKGYRAEGNVLVQLALRPDPALIDSAEAVLTTTASRLGLSEESTEALRQAITAMLANAIAHSSGTEPSVELLIEERGSAIVFAVEDRGMPFDFEDLESGADNALRPLIAMEDEVHFIGKGREGNRIEIVHYFHHKDVRQSLPDQQVDPEPEPVAEDSKTTIRLLEPGDTRELARAIWRCYGYSYPCDFIYSPEEVAHRMELGRFISAGAFNDDGELVGHLALSLADTTARLAESGQAVVDPRWRGHGIFEQLKKFLREHAADEGMVGLYSEAVTQHPFSQKGNLRLGAHEIGFLLGYGGSGIEFRGIDGNKTANRQSVAFMYLPINDHPPQDIHLTSRHSALAEGIYQRLGLDRQIVTKGARPKASQGRFHFNIRPDHQQALFSVDQPGANTATSIASRLAHLDASGVKVTYVDLCAASPSAIPIAEDLAAHGFFFGALIPCMGKSDVLRLQRLAGVELTMDSIKTASDDGATMLH